MRKMASIQKVHEILPHINADSLELAMINDWLVVVKKGEFVKDQMVVYFEIDSWIPHEIAPFLSKGKEPKIYEDISGERLRSIKLRKELSQGLILSLNADILFRINYWVTFNIGLNEQLFEEMDVTEALNVVKWEPSIPACLRGKIKGNFPTEIPKTDQERIQNLSKHFNFIKTKQWEVTEKLNGSSCSFYLDMDNNFHVCSRNLDLQFEENNAYWKAAGMYNIELMMKYFNALGYAIQGELVGEGINGNQYRIKGVDFYVFDVYSVKDSRYMTPKERYNVVEVLGLKHVPIISMNQGIQVETIRDLLNRVEGEKSKINGSNIEGGVFKTEDVCYDNRDVTSFKVISNTWLLENE